MCVYFSIKHISTMHIHHRYIYIYLFIRLLTYVRIYLTFALMHLGSTQVKYAYELSAEEFE